jgi:hypothetical protein
VPRGFMVVVPLCLAAALSSCGHAATNSAKAARAPAGSTRPGVLPLPSGPVISIDDDHPYTAQAVAAASAQSWKGEAAPSGYHYVVVMVAVVPPPDGPPLAAGFTDYDLGVLYPGCGTYCFNSLERAVAYATRDNAQSVKGGADSGQLLEPGVSYYATLHQQVPAGIDLGATRLCRSGQPDGVCSPLGSLPRLTP